MIIRLSTRICQRIKKFWLSFKMRISIAVLILSLVAVHGNDSDEDSSEFGVVDGAKGTNCKCGWANKVSSRF